MSVCCVCWSPPGPSRVRTTAASPPGPSRNTAGDGSQLLARASHSQSGPAPASQGQPQPASQGPPQRIRASPSQPPARQGRTHSHQTRPSQAQERNGTVTVTGKSLVVTGRLLVSTYPFSLPVPWPSERARHPAVPRAIRRKGVKGEGFNFPDCSHAHHLDGPLSSRPLSPRPYKAAAPKGPAFLFLKLLCMTAGRGGTEVHWMLRCGACDV